MPDSHAILSASASHRWLMCPPSVRLCEQFPGDGASEYAAEGTEAHELCEFKLKTALGMDATDPTPELSRYSEEMDECATGYASFVLELVNEAAKSCSDPKVLIEQRVDFSQWVPEGFGTADCIIVSDGTLRIVDYKHGLGVLVEAENNPQMKCYALGALEIFDVLYDIEKVSMTIYQPRRENISTWEISREELIQWAENTLKPIASLAFAGEGKFCAGEWCGFCKAKHACRARAEANLLLAKHDFKLPDLLEDIEIEVLLSQVDELTAWANDVKEYARNRLSAVRNGTAGSSLKDALSGNSPARTKSSRLYARQGSTRSRKSFWALLRCRSSSGNPDLMSFFQDLSQSRKANRRSCRRAIKDRRFQVQL